MVETIDLAHQACKALGMRHPRVAVCSLNPHPGDTIFIAAVQGKFDLVVAVYDNRGVIPVKLLARDRAVNMTVGLPIIRTSPDHGTAFDIAGKNAVDPGSMTSAVEFAIRLVAARHART